MKDKNVVLVGFMGTGKTSVGKALSKVLHRPVIDVDNLIEKKEGIKIREIFEKKGEAHFRVLEQKAIAEIADKKAVIITTGGGAMMEPANVSCLKKNGLLLELTAGPETILRRVGSSRKRPLLNTAEPLEQIKKLLESRKSYYVQADYHIQTDGKTPKKVAGEILEILKGQI